MYQTLLGSAFHSLPNALQALHRPLGLQKFSGVCEVRRGDSLVSQLLGRAASLPPAGPTALTLTIEPDGDREVWIREFGPHRMRSVLQARNGRLHESLGLARFVFALRVAGERIVWVLEDVRAMGVKLPVRWFDLDVSEYGRAGRYYFDVHVNVRGIGLLVHYAGWLE